MKTPIIKLPAPIKTQYKCYSKVSYVTPTNYPPNSTIAYYTINVTEIINQNNILLNKPLKIFISLLSNFLELNSLKTCINTKA